MMMSLNKLDFYTANVKTTFKQIRQYYQYSTIIEKMQTSFDIKVAIKDDLRKGLIFGLKARLPIAMILVFLGDKYGVIPILQTVSHGTRAFIVNA